MRPRELVLRDLSGRVKQEDSGDQFGGPGHTFSFSLEKEDFFSNFFLQYSCSHVTLNESCTFSPSTFIGVSVWKQRETAKMINSFFNRKIKIPHSLLQVLVPPHPPVRVCFLVHKRVFFSFSGQMLSVSQFPISLRRGGGRVTLLLHGLYGNVPLNGVWFLSSPS